MFRSPGHDAIGISLSSQPGMLPIGGGSRRQAAPLNGG